MNPVQQDPLLPWGNLGRSGVSHSIDFLGKGLRVAVIESWSSEELPRISEGEPSGRPPAS